MTKVLKWFLIVLGGELTLVAVICAVSWIRLNSTYGFDLLFIHFKYFLRP